jgi:curved DNA-binding protein CbpA
MPEFRRQEAIDLYEVLGVSPHASQDVIQAAYRVLARVYHPDLNATSDAGYQIRALNEAYRVLRSPPDRARYDLERARAHRHDWVINPEHVRASTRLSRPARRRPQLTHPAAAVVQPIEERLSMLSGQVMVGLILVATVAVMALGLVWASFEASADNAHVYRGPTVEFTGR